ncbi:hypothetical protein L3V83_05525 [Thiotrichales bacterium 19X7-9]|nr:hypothetical protein [Thiotrichales bacterium 19X7-9]
MCKILEQELKYLGYPTINRLNNKYQQLMYQGIVEISSDNNDQKAIFIPNKGQPYFENEGMPKKGSLILYLDNMDKLPYKAHIVRNYPFDVDVDKEMYSKYLASKYTLFEKTITEEGGTVIKKMEKGLIYPGLDEDYMNIGKLASYTSKYNDNKYSEPKQNTFLFFENDRMPRWNIDISNNM